MVDKPAEGWKSMTGFVTAEMIAATMPKPAEVPPPSDTHINRRRPFDCINDCSVSSWGGRAGNAI